MLDSRDKQEIKTIVSQELQQAVTGRRGIKSFRRQAIASQSDVHQSTRSVKASIKAAHAKGMWKGILIGFLFGLLGNLLTSYLAHRFGW